MIYIIQGLYNTNYGWEEVEQTTNYKEALKLLNEYNLMSYPHRLIKRNK